jgi:hypothetical protein
MEALKKDPLRRAHFVGTSVVVTIDPIHVRRLAIDDMTFFVQRPIENGIVLEMHRLDTDNQRSASNNQIAGSDGTTNLARSQQANAPPPEEMNMTSEK